MLFKDYFRMFGPSVLISAEGKGNVEVVVTILNRCTRDLILNATFKFARGVNV